MIELFDKRSGEKLTLIAEDHLDFLVDHLESDTYEENAYVIDKQALAYLEGQGAPEPLLTLLRDLLGKKKKIEIEYHIIDDLDFDYDEE